MGKYIIQFTRRLDIDQSIRYDNNVIDFVKTNKIILTSIDDRIEDEIEINNTLYDNIIMYLNLYSETETIDEFLPTSFHIEVFTYNLLKNENTLNITELNSLIKLENRIYVGDLEDLYTEI